MDHVNKIKVPFWQTRTVAHGDTVSLFREMEGEDGLSEDDDDAKHTKDVRRLSVKRSSLRGHGFKFFAQCTKLAESRR